jgi:DNA modification methylase
MNIDLRQGDCLEVLKTIPDNSVDSVVTDPPYHLTSIVKRVGKEGSAPAQFGTDGAYARASKGFMGKEWDGGDIAFRTDVWSECLRVLKPGGHLLSFSHSRTYHRMAVAIEDAGFEIRDSIMWIYGSGFPKSHNIGKAIDKRGGESIGWFGEWLKKWRNENQIPQSQVAELFPSKTGGLTGCVSNWELGNNLPTNEQFNKICETFNLPFKSLEEAEREFIGTKTSGIGKAFTKDGWGSGHDEVEITKGQSDYEGWGTALKPAHEPICMARKPLSEKSIAENVLKWGTGGINIDGCRIESELRTTPIHSDDVKDDTTLFGLHKTIQHERVETTEGRFPANIILDEEAGKLLDEQSGISKSTGAVRKKNTDTNPTSIDFNHKEGELSNPYAGQVGGASRFFYCPKTSKKERDAGLTGDDKILNRVNSGGLENDTKWAPVVRKNNHPTVKPLKLMEYLIKLVTPKGGVVMDCFMGSGSTGVAARNLGFKFIGIEREQEYMDIAKQRITQSVQTKLDL